MIRVLIADDHHLVRAGTRALLEKSSEIEVVGEAQDGLTALEMTEKLKPDVLVMDIAMPRLNGIQALERIGVSARTQVVVLSMYSNEILVRRALQNGAKGYLLKESVSEELLLAIMAASRGATYLSPAISEAILMDVWTTPHQPSIPGKHNPLTPREMEVLQLIFDGFTNSRIASSLNISIKTVERHRAKLMAKLDAHNTAELIRSGLKAGLLVLDD